MGTRHKHADVIIAWANGAEVEYWNESLREWLVHDWPRWYEHLIYRIKAKRVKKEGWIGVHNEWTTERIYETEKACRADCNSSAVIIRIEWEEDA